MPEVFDARQVGIAVRDCRDPTIRGTTTGQVRRHGGRDLASIRFVNGSITFIPLEYLELVPKHETRSEAFARQRVGGPKELARQLLAEKIGGNLTDVFYSIGSGKAVFFPHQFRPVLTFVESSIGRILVADEVGLGKTISAIYIWKELQARAGARRLLIVCPAVLRPKWKAELRDRFSIDAQIVDAGDLREHLESARRDTLRSFVLIGSLEGLRSRRRVQEDAARGARQKLMRWLQENPATSEFDPFDLVIIDEAHASRNPETANHHFAEVLREATPHLVLLTATPLQTASENLFNLLKLVDPDRFVSLETFEQARRANTSIIGAVNALLRIPPDPEGLNRHLQDAIKQPLFRNDKTLRSLAHLQPISWSQSKRVHMARLLESRSLLADVMVRTRKRDAFPNRVERVPWVLDVTLSKQEQQLYNHLSARIRKFAREQHAGTSAEFILIGRQRQLASSIAATLNTWRKMEEFQELLWDDLGVDADLDSGDETIVPVEDLLTDYDFEAGDTKYNAFVEALKQKLRDNPKEKIVVFAFFRGTLAYLKRRLEADGIRCGCIFGNMGTEIVDGEKIDAKTAEIARFAASDGPSVLLSSEVGSEGIDLQFAHMLFNYDLPWNPMKVEQRIGRIDRIGQYADRIAIGHFAVTGTIDDRIINRLYERINVFKESIGDIDEIFGERTQKILVDYFREKLSPEETEHRLDQNILVAENTKLETQRLEREAPALAGHADFILQSISASKAAGRYIRPDDLRSYITDFLSERYSGSSVEYLEGSPNIVSIVPSADARDSLAAFIGRERPARRTRLSDPGATVIATFDPNTLAPGRLRTEVVDVAHPLVLWIRSIKAAETADLVPAIAAEINVAKAEVSPGLYVFACDLWRFEGLRKQIAIRYAVHSIADENWLEPPVAERLIDNASQFGEPVDLFDHRAVHSKLLDALILCEKKIEEDYLADFGAFELENTIRTAQARELIEASTSRKLESLNATLDKQKQSDDERQRRIIPMIEARIRKIRDERDKQLARIERQGRIESNFRPIVGGLIVVSGKIL
jgi:SNF2 family DNA or RNA helicase